MIKEFSPSLFWRRRMGFTCLSLFCFWALAQDALATAVTEDQDAPATAATEDIDEDETEDTAQAGADWQAERDEIFKQIKKNVQEYVNKTVTRESTTKFIFFSINRGLNLPDKGGNYKNLRGVSMKEWQWDNKDKGVSIPDPKQSLEEIIAKRTDDITNRVRKMYPELKRKQFVLDAHEKYKMFQKNEHISFVLRGGVGTNTQVQGTFYDITSERVQVGKRFITRRDLDEDTEAKFYRDKNEIRIKLYIERMNSQYDATIENTIEDLKRRELPPEFHASGYVPDPAMDSSSIRTAKPEYWVARRELHTRTFNLLRELARQAYTPIETKRLFTEKGFVEGENEEGKIEWMPQAEYDRLQALKQGAAAQPGGGGVNPDDMPMEPPPM